ncbi:hypothetical protein ACP70R_023014 [Stipagrostis hirtigluma subsp. patula]
MARAEQPTSWSDLPAELAGLVLCRLPAYPDRVRFGAVCHHWSFSAAQNCLPPPLPCLSFSDGAFFSLPCRESFQFPDSASYHSSCGEWLIFSCDGACSLKNPFSKITMTLPNLSCFFLIDEPMEIINGRATQDGEMPQDLPGTDAKMSIDKIIVCSLRLVVAVVYIGPIHTVALCRPGADSWFFSGLFGKNHLIDMMFYEGKLYAIDKYKDLLSIDIGEDNDNGKLSISRIERLVESVSQTFSVVLKGITFINQFLVESRGALLLVRTSFFGMSSHNGRGCMSTEPVGIEFKVFQADFHSSRWVGVTSLGDDQVLFMGKSYSQSVDVSQYKLKGNSIFILDDGTCNWFWKNRTSSCAVYDMSDETTYLPMPEGSLKGDKAQATWLFPPTVM